MRDKRAEYRVVFTGDTFFTYELQIKKWWFPMWWGLKTGNTVRYLEGYARDHAAKVIKDLGKLP